MCDPFSRPLAEQPLGEISYGEVLASILRVATRTAW